MVEEREVREVNAVPFAETLELPKAFLRELVVEEVALQPARLTE